MASEPRSEHIDLEAQIKQALAAKEDAVELAITFLSSEGYEDARLSEPTMGKLLLKATRAGRQEDIGALLNHHGKDWERAFLNSLRRPSTKPLPPDPAARKKAEKTAANRATLIAILEARNPGQEKDSKSLGEVSASPITSTPRAAGGYDAKLWMSNPPKRSTYPRGSSIKRSCPAALLPPGLDSQNEKLWFVEECKKIIELDREFNSDRATFVLRGKKVEVSESSQRGSGDGLVGNIHGGYPSSTTWMLKNPDNLLIIYDELIAKRPSHLKCLVFKGVSEAQLRPLLVKMCANPQLVEIIELEGVGELDLTKPAAPTASAAMFSSSSLSSVSAGSAAALSGASAPGNSLPPQNRQALSGGGMS